jgi:hypothetical protein
MRRSRNILEYRLELVTYLYSTFLRIIEFIIIFDLYIRSSVSIAAENEILHRIKIES